MLISPEEFKTRWGEPLMRFDENLISNVPLSEEDRSFLLQAGFPEDAAPFLSFDDFSKGLKPIYEVWGSPSDYSGKDINRLKSYLVIGSDGAGNPIAIDVGGKCQIFHLDHDDWFNTVKFVNSSISQLAVFLLLTKEMIEKANSELSEKELDEEIPESYKKEVLDLMEKVDSKAIAAGDFWKPEVGML